MDRTRRWLSWICVVLAAASLPCASFGGETAVAKARPPADFEPCLQQMCQWRSSLYSLQVRYRWGSGNPQDGSYQVRDWTWVDRWVVSYDERMCCNSEQREEGRVIAQRWVGRDGQMQIECEKKPPVGERWTTKAVSLDKCSPEFPRCHPLESMYLPGLGWCFDSFRRNPPVFYGEREIEGSRCIGYRPYETSGYVVWLDPQHGGLPRLVELTETPSPWCWKCSEYMQLESGHWLPRRGTFGWEEGPQSWFEVEQAVANQPPPAEVFHPEQALIALTVAGKGINPPQVQESRVWVWRITLALALLCAAFSWRQWRQTIPSRRERLLPQPKYVPNLAP